MNEIRDRMTPGRRAWLEKLRDEGPSRRTRGPVGFQCMQLKWTEWDYRIDGLPVSQAEAQKRFGEEWFRVITWNEKERITELGRWQLQREI